MSNRNALIPDPLQSSGQYERFHHLDIRGLEDTDLTDELHALRPLLWGLPTDHWLRERVRMLEAELIKRQGSIDREYRALPKPKLTEGVEL